MFGPSYHNVIQQYWNIIGNPFLVPYWSLGFHLCRWGYNTLNRTLQVVNNMRDNNIPYKIITCIKFKF